MRGKAFVGDEEQEEQEEEVGLGNEIPSEDRGWLTSGKGPEEEEGENERNGNGGCKSVCSLMMWERG